MWKSTICTTHELLCLLWFFHLIPFRIRFHRTFVCMRIFPSPNSTRLDSSTLYVGIFHNVTSLSTLHTSTSRSSYTRIFGLSSIQILSGTVHFKCSKAVLAYSSSSLSQVVRLLSHAGTPCFAWQILFGVILLIHQPSCSTQFIPLRH